MPAHLQKVPCLLKKKGMFPKIYLTDEYKTENIDSLVIPEVYLASRLSWALMMGVQEG